MTFRCTFSICQVSLWSAVLLAPQVLAQVDETHLGAAGIRKLESKHLTLYTDLPVDAEVDQLPAIFDQAVPQWADALGVDQSRISNWRIRAYLIQDRSKFDAVGLMPPGNDSFRHGFSLGHELWLYEQPTPYYRRHLLLHEGTHNFMATQLGRCGPGWFMEGMAELLATHQLDRSSGQLVLRHLPASPSEVPMLGRIKLVQDAFRDRQALTLPAVLAIDNRQFLENKDYAWCWAAARLLDDHPHYRERFRSLLAHVQDPGFNARVRRLFADDWEELSVEWQNFVATLDHGHDIQRTAIDFQPGKPIAGDETVDLRVDQGWQSSQLMLKAGETYRIVATGRYQISEDEAGPWWCEPGGITLKYHRGNPLGVLLGAIDPGDGKPSRAAHFLEPWVLGLNQTVQAEHDGTLYLCVNDSPGRLGDNDGTLRVTIQHDRRPRSRSSTPIDTSRSQFDNER